MRVHDAFATRLAYSLHGLQQATLRCDAAHWHRPEDAFTAAAEAASWVVALDAVLERSVAAGRGWGAAYSAARKHDPDGKTVRAMKFVRNQMHHGDELHDFVFLNAVVGNPTYGMRAGWVWRLLEEIDPPLNPTKLREATSFGYREHLGGQDILHTLLDANRWFSSLSPPLPSLPPDETGSDRPEFALPERWPPIEGDRHI